MAALLTRFLSPSSADSVDACIDQLNPPSSTVTSVYVLPDDGHAPVLDEITHARCRIDLSMYLLSDDEVIVGLEDALNRGIAVRVILEPQPFLSYGGQQDVFDRLSAAGASVHWSSSEFTFSHNNYMIVDNQVLVVTNQNFTNAAFSSNREFGIVTSEARYVQEAATLFDADWRDIDVPEPFRALVVSPVNSRSTILELINGSTDRVWLYAEVLRDEGVTQALDDAADRGVQVRILVNPTADEDDVPYFLDAMNHGVQVRVLSSPYVHAKAMVVDDAAVLIGSQNYSTTSLDKNREVGIVLADDDSIDRVSQVFELDWSRADPVDSVSLVRPWQTDVLLVHRSSELETISSRAVSR